MDELYISGRERKIVELLLQAQQIMTIKQLGSELEVSSRTIHRDLKNVEEILDAHHLKLKRKSGAGLEVVGHEEDKGNLQDYLNGVKHTDFRPEERQEITILTLLEKNEPVKLNSLANELQVTIATISNDLDKVQNILADYGLTLIRRRGYGIQIKGNEKDKRAVISHLMMDHLDEFDFISLLKSNIQKKTKQDIEVISNRLLGIINPEKLQIIEREVGKVRATLPYGLADSAYIGLVVHLALAIERLQQGDTIQFDQTYLQQIQGLQEYDIASMMIKKLEKTLDMAIPDDEIGYITMHLMGAKSRIDHNYSLEDANLDIAFQARRLIHYVDQTLNIDLMDNQQLLHDLVAHLKPMIYRLQQNMKIKNPLITEIMKDYQELFQVVKAGVCESFPEINFPKEEIGYLVLHFGAASLHSKVNIELRALVVCPSGIGTAKMLAERLLQKIPEIKRVENKSIFEIDEEQMDEYDLIVSTIPLQGHKDYILASPILTKTDIDNINKVVRRKRLGQPVVKKDDKDRSAHNLVDYLQMLQNYSTAMLDLLASFYVEQIEKDNTIEVILADVCKQLADKQILDNEQQVFTDLLARERMNGLGIPGTTLALYHTRSTGVQGISFSIYTLKNPLTIKGMDGQAMECKHILLMLAPKETNQETLEILSLLSGLIIRDEESIKRFESTNEKKIYSLISEQLRRFINEKI